MKTINFSSVTLQITFLLSHFVAAVFCTLVRSDVTSDSSLNFKMGKIINYTKLITNLVVYVWYYTNKKRGKSRVNCYFMLHLLRKILLSSIQNSARIVLIDIYLIPVSELWEYRWSGLRNAK